MSTDTSLADHAEALLIRLTHVVAERENANAWNKIETTRRRANQSRAALQEAMTALSKLESVTCPKQSAPKAKELQQARKILRSTATNIVGIEIGDMASRVSSESVDRSLTLAEERARWLLTEMNRAVDKRRIELQPDRISEPVVAYPGVKYSIILGLQRTQRTLLTPVAGVVSAQELVNRLQAILNDVSYWQTNRPLLDDAEKSQHEEIRRFLAEAASADGAPWESITDVVRDWLSMDDNSDAVRIHLRS